MVFYRFIRGTALLAGNGDVDVLVGLIVVRVFRIRRRLVLLSAVIKIDVERLLGVAIKVADNWCRANFNVTFGRVVEWRVVGRSNAGAGLPLQLNSLLQLARIRCITSGWFSDAVDIDIVNFGALRIARSVLDVNVNGRTVKRRVTILDVSEGLQRIISDAPVSVPVARVTVSSLTLDV